MHYFTLSHNRILSWRFITSFYWGGIYTKGMHISYVVEIKELGPTHMPVQWIPLWRARTFSQRTQFPRAPCHSTGPPSRLLSLQIRSPFPGSSYSMAYCRVRDEWKNIFSLCWALFTQQNGFEIHSCCCLCPRSIPFYCWAVFCHMTMESFVYLCGSEWASIDQLGKNCHPNNTSIWIFRSSWIILSDVL